MFRNALPSVAAAAVVALSATIGVAAAQAPGVPTPPQRSIVVQGSTAIAAGNRGALEKIDEIYHETLEKAFGEAGVKAGVLAQRAGMTLGPVHSVVETSSSPDLSVVQRCIAKIRRSQRGIAFFDAAGYCPITATVTVTYAAV